ncbi:hypothetical protein [Paenibacillus koleovorans]|uniref:hypothetical protein n=1 Tax=Paenibacillus koleovorans TaxID=121608 RepID=UPI000FDC5834|nr:hypothetical protein [Paenibacillus koleovorans]
MARTVTHVPYGYEPEVETIRGTLIVYDAFDESFDERRFEAWLDWAERRQIARIVLYPLHEETLRRMISRSAAAMIEPYHARLRRLEELGEAFPQAEVPFEIDEWERKRKKYTPVDTALDFLCEKHKGPHFVAMSGDMANRFASYSSFEPWIRKLRLVVDSPLPFTPHPKLNEFSHRWSLLAEPDRN